MTMALFFLIWVMERRLYQVGLYTKIRIAHFYIGLSGLEEEISVSYGSSKNGVCELFVSTLRDWRTRHKATFWIFFNSFILNDEPPLSAVDFFTETTNDNVIIGNALNVDEIQEFVEENRNKNPRQHTSL